MTDRPIIFSGPMARALLAGTKTMTRRVLKPQPEWPLEFSVLSGGKAIFRSHSGARQDVRVPYAVGDRLWVKETAMPAIDAGAGHFNFAADYDGDGLAHMASMRRWTPSIFMPRRASRLTLIVEAVKVERVQDISADDARAEGHSQGPAHYSPECHDDAARDWFMDLWNTLNAKRGFGWDDNPWIVAPAFRVTKQNINALPAAA